MPKIHVFAVLVLLAFIGPACSNTNESDLPLHAPGLSTPVVTGLRITGASGPTELAVWGIPSDPDDTPPRYSGGGDQADTVEPDDGWLPRYYAFSNAYPNPTNNQASFKWALPKESLVSLWVVRARWQGSPNRDLVSIGGSTVPAPNNRAVKSLLHSSILGPGLYRAEWDGRNDNDEPVPGGFYRIYFQADQFSSWRDILLYRSLDDIPGDLRTLMHR